MLYLLLQPLLLQSRPPASLGCRVKYMILQLAGAQGLSLGSTASQDTADVPLLCPRVGGSPFHTENRLLSFPIASGRLFLWVRFG